MIYPGHYTTEVWGGEPELTVQVVREADDTKILRMPAVASYDEAFRLACEAVKIDIQLLRREAAA